MKCRNGWAVVVHPWSSVMSQFSLALH
uniref:Uncharacterized protein n=1 Tax=Anguilla anguilla TaxID=7936 RepID=A0A0E9SZI2_ANGAN